MSLWKIAWRSMQYRALASSLTALSMALGIALVVAVLVIYGTVNQSFGRGSQGFDIIVGPKSGRLELVLNSVFHLGTPVGKIPWTYYKEFLPQGKFGKQVGEAIPICLGDNYQGFRVVGTTPRLFELEYLSGHPYRFAQGKNFAADHFFDAVIGAQVARRTGLRVGDQFEPTHGVTDDGQGHKHDAFTVTGILEPTGTRNDFALFINIEGFYLLEGHAEEPAAKPAAGADAKPDHDHDHQRTPLPEAQRAVSAILVRSANPLVNAFLPRTINNDVVAQAVLPTREVQVMFETLVGPMQFILLALAALVVVVTGIGVMVSIYNSMSERRREVAIMRSLGAGRKTVLTIVLLESLLLAVAGGLGGWLLGHGLIALLSPLVENYTGVTLSVWQMPALELLADAQLRAKLPPWLADLPLELVLLPLLIVLSALSGLLPALAAYRTDVAKTLASQ